MGDEFSIVLPETHAQKAQELMNRIRSIFLETPGIQPNNANFLLGISAGIATVSTGGCDRSELIFLADTALYYAKKEVETSLY